MKRFEFSEIVAKLPIIFNKFNINMREDSKKYYGRCPIHNGDNSGALNLYKNGAKWICYTKGCHEKYSDNILGFIRGVLSNNSSREYSWADTYSFISDIMEVVKDNVYVSDINSIYLSWWLLWYGCLHPLTSV